MNQSYKDIITVIQRHGPITTGEVCEHLEPLGYGGGMKWQDYRDTVAKQLGYLKTKGDLTGEDRPQPKGKPLRYWSLAESQPQEMASDVAEVEATVQESLTVETATPEPVSVEVKALHKPPMTVQEMVDSYPINIFEPHMFFAYCAGVAFAEKHHGIGQ